ncbi:TPA: hypothetical protein ACHJCJ_002885 [Klebsiella pneumoniae]|nr:hypothetical protein [Klebsiella pneumoniae]HBS6437103.1 hypothetical protein [Klebsiella pneumoniae]
MAGSDDLYKVAIEALTKELYKDLKNSLPSIIKHIVKPYKKVAAKRFKTPESLLESLKNGSVKQNELIVLECKPTTFGPYLRSHYLMPFIGSSSDMRLGPQILSADNYFDIQIIFAQMCSHLIPVGLYPPIDNNLSQISLFPSDANCYGFTGIVPVANNLISSITAIVSQDKVYRSGAPSYVTGIVRQVTQSMFLDKGLPIEIYEELRQSGDLWYIDVYSEGTEINPMNNGDVTEMWGGLYASGHIEAKGEILVKPLIEGVMDAFKNAGYKPEFAENENPMRNDYSVFARGMRFSILPGPCVYSIHMDAELAIDYRRNKNIFNGVCGNILEVIMEAASKSDATIINPRDLDFTYTDSAKSFTILESQRAEQIKDPVAIVVRDWYRKKNSS